MCLLQAQECAVSRTGLPQCAAPVQQQHQVCRWRDLSRASMTKACVMAHDTLKAVAQALQRAVQQSMNSITW